MPHSKSDLRYSSPSWPSCSAHAAIVICGLLVAGSAQAQQAPASTAPATRTAPRAPTAAEVNRSTPASDAGTASDPALVLSPFEVRPEEDSGYQATSTLAGT